MNSIVRALPAVFKGVSKQCSYLSMGSARSVFVPRTYTRSMWYLSRDVGKPQHSINCTCGCHKSFKFVHTKADTELFDFLSEEIKMEKGTKKAVPKLEGFEVKPSGSEVTLTKKFEDEVINIKLNVNNSTDADVQPETQETTPEKAPEMKCQPSFVVEIQKGAKTLAFECSLGASPYAEAESYADSFCINEVSIHSGDWKEDTYSLVSEVMDGNMYDLLMNMLEERGINEEFADKMVDFCTAYEQQLYLGLLENLKSFVAK